MAEKRVTKKENFEAIKAILVDGGYDELAEVMNHEIELVSKKRNTQTKAQKANVELVEKVYEILAGATEPMTAGEVFNIARDNGIDEITSNQKASALLKMLVDAQRVEKLVDGKKSTFKIAEAE